VAALSVLGTSSWAGKSLVATGLCRWCAREGVSVAPFKAQNMSNNARVASGGEMGAAQYLQALAAGVEPECRMNPVLIKPEDDRRSQVVVGGQVDEELSRLDWRERAPAMRPAVEAALMSLLADFELVVIEGAGSPAEINLADSDLSNLHAGKLACANGLLIADMTRGGGLAHLFGTWTLAPADLRARIGGFVLNRFRGDPALLDPAPAELERLTGVPTVGVLPELDHRLPDEDGVAPRLSASSGPRVAVVSYPTASNLDEFRLLEQVAQVVWARRPAELAGAELLILPGSKQPLRDLAWLRKTGLAAAVESAVARGLRVLGICGGLQILGTEIGGEPGLDLLPIKTRLAPDKLVRRSTVSFAALREPWQALAGREVSGYEIRQGRTSSQNPVSEALPHRLGFVAGNVLGIYLHGLLEDPAAVEALTGLRPQLSLDATFDDLADALDRQLDMRRVRALAGLGSSGAPRRSSPAPPPRGAPTPRSLVIVNTGDGKGKSTAAFGVLMRAVARRGWKTCVVQFIKSDRWKVGEETTARRIGVEWVKGGDGFSWESRDLATSEERARDAWQLARERILGGDYQLVVLDEITYPINWGWIDGAEVAEVIRERPERVNVVATGRDAPPALIGVADTVTEMVKVRHVYDRGVKARRGIDF
jgi:adenosylcobyric acid synthase